MATEISLDIRQFAMEVRPGIHKQRPEHVAVHVRKVFIKYLSHK